MAWVATPRPICMAGVPLAPALPALELRSVSLKESARSTCAPLNAVVLTLAMLLPMTSISCWKFCNPLMAELRERSMGVGGLSLVASGSRRDAEQAAQIVALTVDQEFRRPFLHLHGGDLAGDLAVAVLNVHGAS